MKKINYFIAVSMSFNVILYLAQVCASTAFAAETVSKGTVSYSQPLVSVNDGIRHNFESAFDAISEQAKISIIVEGQPLHSQLSDQQIADLNRALPATPTPLDEALKKLAEAYDYSVEEYSPHSFLLRKRYSNPNDLPCVTYEEVLNSLQQTIRLTSVYGTPSFRTDGSFPVQDFYLSLSPAQQQQISRGIPVTELDSRQRHLAQIAAQNTGLMQDQVQLIQSVDVLTGVQRKDSTFGRYVLVGFPAFGYRSRAGVLNHWAEFPLNNRFHIYSSGYAHVTKSSMDNGHLSDDQLNRLYGPDLTIPTDEDRRLAPGILAESLPCSMNLKDFLRDVSAKSMVKPDETKRQTVKLRVVPGLEAKAVSVFGLRYASLDTNVRAVAQLYQLELLVPQHGDYILALPQVRTIQNAADYNKEVVRLTPDPFRRATARQAEIAADAVPALKIAPGLSQVQIEMAQMQRNSAVQVAKNRSLDCYYTAIRRLIVLAQPLVPTPDSPPVPIAKANPEVFRLLAIALYSNSTGMSVKSMTETPIQHYLSDPDSLYLQMTMNHVGNQVFVSAKYGYRDENGKFIVEAAPNISWATPESKTPNSP